MKESPGIHLNFLCKTVTLQRQQILMLSEIIEKQKKDSNNNAYKMQSLENLLGPHFIWKIDNYNVNIILEFKIICFYVTIQLNQ